nr:PREDICTED: uncharacterized protein LOC109029792 isoform X2 [Bemisia tabaci]
MGDSGRFFLGIPSTIIFIQIHLIFQTHGFLDLNVEDVDDSAPHLRPLKISEDATLPYRPFDMLRNSNLFIDQTAFIDTFMGSEDDRVIFCAPRGFGKSTILDMLKRFLEIDTHENGTKKTDKRTHKNYRTFADTIPSTGAHLHIFQQKKFFESNFGEHPVIFLDFDTKGNKTHDSPSFLRFLLNGPIKSAFLDHAYLIHSPIISNEEKGRMRRYLQHTQDLHEIYRKVTDGIILLKRLLRKQFQKQPIILVDNIDSQIYELLFDSDPRQRSNDALDKLKCLEDDLKDCLADHAALKSFITGVLRQGLFPEGLIQSMTRSDEFAKFFSLSKSQVAGLIAAWGINQTVDQLDTWYGLQLNQVGTWLPRNAVKPITRQFNPYSIYRFLLSGSTRLRSYWTELDSLLTFPAAFLPECFGQHLLECFKECTALMPFASAWVVADGWTDRLVKGLQELRRTGECTSLTRAALTLYLMNSGYLFPSAASPATYTYQIPNQEVKQHVSKLLMAVTTSKCPIHGNKQFRDDLFEALFDVDGSHLNMRRFLDMLVVVLVAEERKGPVPATTLAHSLRVQLINPPRLPNKFNVTYVDTSMIEEQTNQHLWRDSQESAGPAFHLVFGLRKREVLMAFAIHMELGNELQPKNGTLTEAHLKVFESREELKNASAKLAASFRGNNQSCWLNYLWNGDSLQDERYLIVEKRTLQIQAEARWDHS